MGTPTKSQPAAASQASASSASAADNVPLKTDSLGDTYYDTPPDGFDAATDARPAHTSHDDHPHDAHPGHLGDLFSGFFGAKPKVKKAGKGG